MPRVEILPIYRDTYCLVSDIFARTTKFPKEYKFSLGEPLNHNLMKACSLISRAGRVENKAEILEEYLSTLDEVVLCLRLGADFQLLNKRQQVYFSQQIENDSKKI